MQKNSLRHRRSRCGVAFEPLESRQLLSVPTHYHSKVAPPPVPTNVNLSKMAENQSEGAIAIDPSHPNRIFAASNLEWDEGLFAAYSTDGGTTWSTKTIANGRDGLIPALSDPTVAFDEYGNLFVGYMSSDGGSVVVAMSANGGKTFQRLARITGDTDQPTVTAAKGQVWVTYQWGDRVAASGAKVSGLGKVTRFSASQAVPGSFGGNFGDIAIGPKGQVMVTYLTAGGKDGPSSIYVSVDPDGAGRMGFRKPVLAATTNMTDFEPIPAQVRCTIDAEPALAFDRSGGVANGRVYLAYTTLNRKVRNDTNIMLRWSEDNGLTWSAPVRINDDRTTNSQFLPRIAVDQTTGDVAMSWHDARQDNGAAPGSVNRIANDDAQLWGVIAKATDASIVLSYNFQISKGTSEASRAMNQIDYGDYTGLAFHGGAIMPIWADNSNSTKDNPDGRLRTFDIYIATITDFLA